MKRIPLIALALIACALSISAASLPFLRYTTEPAADTMTVVVKTQVADNDVLALKVAVYYSYTDAQGGTQGGFKTCLVERSGNPEVSVPVKGVPANAQIRAIQVFALAFKDFATTPLDPIAGAVYPAAQ